VVIVWNQLALTKACLDSLKKNTLYPFRLIIVDNASSQETKVYLQKFAEDKTMEVTLIRNENNLGFVKAANQAMRASTSPYLCLLNNDTLVYPGWLSEMVKVAETKREIGLINPSSNTLGQRPRPDETNEEFAKELTGQSGAYAELGQVSGFCLLVKRPVIEQIGLFDEIFGLGQFEDIDYSRRAQAAGFICVRAKAAYIYHLEKQSFLQHKKFDQDFLKNREIFEKRWGKPKRLLYILDREEEKILAEKKEEILRAAYRGDWVRIFFKDAVSTHGLDHGQVSFFKIGGRGFSAKVFFKIILRKKKFDMIYCLNRAQGKFLKPFAWLRHSEVRLIKDT
jgi:GT2 family glycosyltransferase